MRTADRQLGFGEVLRYARGSNVWTPTMDGYSNFHYYTAANDGTRVSLDSGINLVKKVGAADGPRRPFLALRSSPWKAGHETSPWRDLYDLDHGHVRYFGDHKVDSTASLGATRGNAALAEAWPVHHGTNANERACATPLLLFRSVTVERAVKGYVEFCGVAVIERFEHVIQRDPSSGRSFANYVFDLAVISLASESEHLDMRWLDDRRDPTLTLPQTLRFAPRGWRTWIDEGTAALPRIRRSVAASHLKSPDEQRPDRHSPEHEVLQEVYRHFDRQKHRFELLAARVAGSILRGRGAVYHEGWLTRGTADGGADFVGRLDVGRGDIIVPMVVLGQAKCVKPSTSISAEQIARVVARLRRGWLGAYVTTGVYSRAAQTEIIDDQYPLLLVDGKHLAEEVRRMAFDSHGGDLDQFLYDLVDDYQHAVSWRRPEEALHL